MQSSAEVERKFEAASVEVIAALDPAAVLGHEIPVVADERTLDAIYYDTADLALLGAKVTMRRRTGGADEGWHVKLPAVGDSREEVHLPLGGDDVPNEFRGLVRAFTGGRVLRPVARLTTVRRAWQAYGAAGGLVAELVIDAVTARADDEVLAWTEVEVELGLGAPDGFLDTVTDRLAVQGLERSTSGSKLGRLLQPRLPAPGRPDEDAVPAGSAAAAVLDYLAAQLRALRGHDPLVRLDRPDAVHQMRVAARRTRSCLQSFRRVLDRAGTDPLVAELRWLAGELAPARDTEVMAERLAELFDEVPASLVIGPVRADVDRAFARRAASARERTLAALDGDRYLELLAALDALVADPPLTDGARRPATKELPRAVERAHRQVVAAMTEATALRPGAARDEALHEARKKAKRLRYTTEVARPVLGRPARRLTRRMKAVQELLGVHQDTVVTRTTLLELAAGEVAHGFTLGVLHAEEAARARRAEAELPRVWRRVTRIQ